MGTSDKGINLVRYSRDHPHAYGDKFELVDYARENEGSSPRVWGQVTSINAIRILTGIIPTRMGTRE